MSEFDFDAIMYPVNFVCHYRTKFEADALAEAKRRRMGIIAIKAMARQAWPAGADRSRYSKCWYEPINEPELARLALSWTLAQGVSVMIPPGEEELLRLALTVAPQCGELSAKELSRLEQLAGELQPIFRA